MATVGFSRGLPLPTGWRFLKPKLVLHEQRATSVSLYEMNKKGTREDPPKPSLAYRAHKFFKTFLPESKKFVEEKKIAVTSAPMQAEHGNYEVVFRFDSHEVIDSWTVSTDKDNNQGKSTANFTLSQNRTGLFHGNICTEVPKDGKTKYTGYANVSAPTPVKSFARETHWDWSLFNCLLLKVRGDGRPYMILLGCDLYYDITWLNRWSFPLFTHGGPYWQVAKIPFSKFYVNYKGRIQDKQEHIPLHLVNNFGITLGDQADGPFCLEIDSISVMHDVNLTDKFAYELYHDKHYISQT